MVSHSRMILSIFRRNFVAYFINPAGYVFITVFILLGAVAAFWHPSFFLNNLANLDSLNAFYPLLLLFFVPALTMNVWSEERRQGTDELLFTLPGRDVDIVAGKYLAVLGIFTVALAFSLSHVLILSWLGDPDLGLMAATYLGYWLLGAAMLAVGMVASLLTSNATVAFILGALYCAAFVFVDAADGVAPAGMAEIVRQLGVRPHFEPFGDGVIALADVVYFFALATIMLFLNVALVGRRHVRGGAGSKRHALHTAVRAIGLGAGAMSLFVIVARFGWYVDATAERLHTLQPQTRQMLRGLSSDRPVIIQAFFSPEAPEAFVQTRKNLVNALRRFDDLGGGAVEVVIHDTEPFTETAADAAENYNITPRPVVSTGGSQRTTTDLFLGLVFTSGPEEFVIPFFDRGLPVEYELARSVRVVSASERKRLGVVATDANVFGGFDFQTMSSRPDWSIVEELRKQYDVVQVPASGPYPDDLDALLAILPSSLPQPDLDALADAVKRGVPTLIFDDPLPMFDPNLSPTLPKDAGRNPFQSQGQPPAPPKGDFNGFLESIGLAWRNSSVVWSAFNPHPALADVQPEVVFVANEPGRPTAFSDRSAISEGLQEVVLLFPGFVRPDDGSEGATLSRTPLMQTGSMTGLTEWNSILTQSFLGMQVNPNPRRTPTGEQYALAMHVTGTIPVPTAPPSPNPDDDGSAPAPAPAVEQRSINVIFVSDVDIISETFFGLRRGGFEEFNFDNVPFALNCIDVLAGDESFLALRKHRPRHRILAEVEALSSGHQEERRAETEAAERDAEQQLAEAQQRLDAKVAELQARTELDEQTRAIMLRNLEEVENRRLEVVRAGIELEKNRSIERSRAEMESAIAGIQRSIRWWAAALPPIPPFLLAVALLANRLKREHIGVSERRLVEKTT